ncbi:MAG: hypothetical protein DMH00_07560 [Acidobacteria bacterium]|nr:MAG: hypothetical protein DMH00_07560 [Acidobacteriota bacterium]
MQSSAERVQVPEETTCTRCGSVLSESQDRETTTEGILCRPCSNNRRSELQRLVEEQSWDVNYPMALLGALLGGATGVLAWWCITVWSNFAFGAVAILIGLAVGKGATFLAGDKRSRGLQVMSLGVAGTAYFYATYLVNRTFVQQALAKGGREVALSFLPNPVLFYRVVSLNLDVLDVLFLGIVLYEAWKLTAPRQLR